MSMLQDDFTDVLKRIGGAWAWLLAFGLIAIVAGLCMFFFTGQALYVIAVAFGMYLIVSGVFHFVNAFSVPSETGWLRALFALLSAMAVAAGVYLLAHPILSLLTLTLVVGFFWILGGMLETMIGCSYRGLPHRGWTIVGGIVSVIAGWVLIFFPGVSTLVLALMFGVWLVVYGLIAVMSSFTVHAATKGARALLHPRHT
ncbi:MAG: DUF308 domain-containing protein [Candidatus Dormibacteraeota bacterium]|nr:DUF308 domain-containing protein [Candidatus Dormibacteraeota bacterium]